jgi:hypothetical protein
MRHLDTENFFAFRVFPVVPSQFSAFHRAKALPFKPVSDIMEAQPYVDAAPLPPVGQVERYRLLDSLHLRGQHGAKRHGSRITILPKRRPQIKV